jgi:hypothetical protein
VSIDGRGPSRAASAGTWRSVRKTVATASGTLTSRAAHRPQRLAAVLGWEGRADDRHRRRQHQRTAAALRDARDEQQPELGRQATDRGRGGEGDRAGQEHAAPAEQVAQAAAEHEQSGQRQQAAVEHPLNLLGPDAERRHHVRQRQRHRGLVDEDHRVGQRHRGEHEAEAGRR